MSCSTQPQRPDSKTEVVDAFKLDTTVDFTLHAVLETFDETQLDSVAEPDTQELAQSLPFEFLRQDERDPVEPQEIDEFTDRLLSFLNSIHFFRWVSWTSHGLHKSTGCPDYLVWWHDVDAIKEVGNKYAAQVVEQYSKGITSICIGMVCNESDPNFLHFGTNHRYSQSLIRTGGRQQEGSGLHSLVQFVQHMKCRATLLSLQSVLG